MPIEFVEHSRFMNRDASFSDYENISREELEKKQVAYEAVLRFCYDIQQGLTRQLLVSGWVGVGKTQLALAGLNWLSGYGVKAARVSLLSFQVYVHMPGSRGHWQGFEKARQYDVLIIDDVYGDEGQLKKERERYCLETLLSERGIRSTIVLTDQHSVSDFRSIWGEKTWNFFDEKVEFNDDRRDWRDHIHIVEPF